MIERQASQPDQLHSRKDKRCPACGSKKLTKFFEVKKLPVGVGVFLGTAEEARRAQTGAVTLVFCHECGFVHNQSFDPNLLQFEPGYEIALHHSEVFRSFIKGVADRLVDRFDLHDKNIFEIGCGEGYFLRLLCEMGANSGVGIDPTVAREGTEVVGSGQVQLIRDSFSDRFRDLDPDFVCCLSVFEDIAEPARCLKDLRGMVDGRQTAIYFEVFNAFRAFQERETWSINYEQCNYFSSESLTDLFRRSGFEVLESSTCYEGDQYLFIDALASPGARPLPSKTAGVPLDLPEEMSGFADAHREKLQSWRRRLDEFRRREQRVVAWGTGGKGIHFLNALETSDSIEYVVEINPNKQGKFVPGSAQQIVPPAFLAEYRPDVVIVTNSLYENEMKQQARELGVECKFMIA